MAFLQHTFPSAGFSTIPLSSMFSYLYAGSRDEFLHWRCAGVCSVTTLMRKAAYTAWDGDTADPGRTLCGAAAVLFGAACDAETPGVAVTLSAAVVLAGTAQRGGCRASLPPERALWRGVAAWRHAYWRILYGWRLAVTAPQHLHGTGLCHTLTMPPALPGCSVLRAAAFYCAYAALLRGCATLLLWAAPAALLHILTLLPLISRVAGRWAMGVRAVLTAFIRTVTDRNFLSWLMLPW